MRYERIAGALLGAAVAVLLLSPAVIGNPNVLAVPAAMVAGVAGVAAWSGSSVGRRLALLISLAGLGLSVMWLGLASFGFGKGVPWWDDIVEAGLLAAALLAAALLLRLARGR